MLGSEQHGLVKDQPSSETAPAREHCSADLDGPAEKESNEDAGKGAATEEVPEVGDVGVAVEVDRVEDEAGDEDRGQEASAAHCGPDELASHEGENHAGDEQEHTEEVRVPGEVVPELADVELAAGLFGNSVDVGLADVSEDAWGDVEVGIVSIRVTIHVNAEGCLCVAGLLAVRATSIGEANSIELGLDTSAETLISAGDALNLLRLNIIQRVASRISHARGGRIRIGRKPASKDILLAEVLLINVVQLLAPAPDEVIGGCGL